MSWRGCERESDVTAAVLSGAWPLGCDPELNAHVAICRPCAELARVGSALRSAAPAGGPRTSAAAIWWRGRLQRQHANLERAAKPVALAERLAAGIVAVSLVALAITHPTAIETWRPALVWTGGVGFLVAAAAFVYHFAGRE